MLVRILLIALLALPLAAQEKKEERRDTRVCKLEYVIAESEGGRRIEARDYSILVDGDRPGRVRIGNRVPIYGPGGAVQYMDIGVNIDARISQPTDGGLKLSTLVEVNSIVSASKPEPDRGNPTMRNFKTENDIRVTFGKPTTLFVMDEPNSKRSIQIQVTATLAP